MWKEIPPSNSTDREEDGSTTLETIVIGFHRQSEFEHVKIDRRRRCVIHRTTPKCCNCSLRIGNDDPAFLDTYVRSLYTVIDIIINVSILIPPFSSTLHSLSNRVDVCLISFWYPRPTMKPSSFAQGVVATIKRFRYCDDD